MGELPSLDGADQLIVMLDFPALVLTTFSGDEGT